jgi:hypothetical protein
MPQPHPPIHEQTSVPILRRAPGLGSDALLGVTAQGHWHIVREGESTVARAVTVLNRWCYGWECLTTRLTRLSAVGRN